MPIGDGAALRARGEVGLEPLLLGRAGAVRDVRVQGDDVPIAQVVAVIALRGVAGRRAEVAEIAGGAGRVVIVVARCRPGARFVPTPGRAVAVRVVGARAIGVGVVAQGENGARDGVQQVRGERIRVHRAIGDVAGPDEDDRAGRVHLHGDGVRTGARLTVRDRDVYAVEPKGGVDVGRGNRRRGACRGPRARAAIPPGDGVGPGCIVRSGIGERGGQRNRVIGVRREIGAAVDARRRGRWGRPVARAASRVAEVVAGDGDELPGVAGGAEGEFQYARGAAVVHLAVRQGTTVEGIAPHPARGDGELPDAQLGIRRAIGALRGEALVHFVVRIKHDRRAGGVEIVPQRFHGGIDDGEPVARRGAEARQMPNGDRAVGRVGREVGLEPLLLGRADGHGKVAVEHHDVPVRQIVAVVELR